MKRYLYNKKKPMQISISICLIHKIGTPLKLGPLNLHLTYMYGDVAYANNYQVDNKIN